MKQLTRIAAILMALAVLAAGCAPGEEEVSPEPEAVEPPEEEVPPDDGEEPTDRGAIKVGLLNPVAGVFGVLGEDANAGFELYLEQNDGRLGGYEVEVVKEDTGDPDAAVAIEAVQKVVEQEQADILVGFIHSGVAYAASTAIIESGVPLLITTAGANDLTQRDKSPNIFRTSYTNSHDATPMADYACNVLGYERIAVISLDYAFGWEGAGGFMRGLTDEGCSVIQELYVPLGTEDWGPFVQQLDQSADAVWALNTSADAIRFVQTYRDFGIDVPLIGHGALTDTHELAVQQDAAEGIITTLHWTEGLETQEFRNFWDSFVERYGRDPTQSAENAYNAATAIDHALRDLDEFDRDAFLENLSGVEFDAPRGPFRFDEYNHVVHNIYVREVQQVEGEWQNEVIDTYPEVSQFWTYGPDAWMDFEPYDQLLNTWADN